MKTLYIDHNILADESNWELLEKIIKENELTLVLSDWNLVEIAQATDIPQATKRIEFLESVNPLWLIPKVNIYEAEVRQFVLKNYFGHTIEELPKFITSYTVSLSYDCGTETPIGASPRKMVESWQRDPSGLLPIVEGKKEATQAANFMKTVSEKDKKAKKDVLFKEWVRPFIPHKKADAILVAREEQEVILEYCYKNRVLFFDECPSLGVEEQITDIRARDKVRPPTDQDAIDLEHQLLALPHCDYLVTADGFIRYCIKFVAQSIKVAVAVKSLEELEALLS